MGRKGKYETDVLPRLSEISGWYQTMNESQIAQKLGVSVSSFENYKSDHPELCEALKKGKEILVDDLKDSLKKRAKGFHYTETKTTTRTEKGKKVQVVEEYKRYSPPDVGAIHLLLKNLDDTWRNDDKTTIDLKRQKLELEKQKATEENWV